MGVPDKLKGYMWKRSPQNFRLRAFDWRYVIVRDQQVTWWKSEDEAKAYSEGKAEAKGFILMQLGPVDIEVEHGNDTSFTLKPAGGQWPEGAIAKGDLGRGFTFDTSKSEYTRAQWTACIAKQIQMANAARIMPPDAMVPSKSTAMLPEKSANYGHVVLLPSAEVAPGGQTLHLGIPATLPKDNPDTAGATDVQKHADQLRSMQMRQK